MGDSIDQVIESLLPKMLNEGIIVVCENNQETQLIMGAKVLQKEGTYLHLGPAYPAFEGLLVLRSPPLDDTFFVQEIMAAKINAGVGFLENALWDQDEMRKGTQKLESRYLPYLHKDSKVDINTIRSFQIVDGSLHDYHYPPDKE